MTDAELIDRCYKLLLHWLRPDPGPDAEETLLQLIEAYEQSGREFIKADYPAND